MISSTSANRLAEAISSAKLWEQLPRKNARTKPIEVIALGSAVRARRLAEAVYRLGPEYAYEAQLQMRALLEIHVNYSWIRLRRPHSRAIRFIRYVVIEKLKVAEDLARGSPERAAALKKDIARLRKQRTRTRHLFRRRNSKGWDKNWAGGLTLEARLQEILKVSRAAGRDVDPFLYTLYRWLSGPAHGSAQSFDDVLAVKSRKLFVKEDAELVSTEVLDGASATLISLWTMAAEDFGFERQIKHQIRARLAEMIRAFQEQKEKRDK